MLIERFIKELEEESNITRKMLALVPADKLDWQPHTKSMTMRALTIHISEIPAWISFGLLNDEVDFATMPTEKPTVNSSDDLLTLFEKSLTYGKDALKNANESSLEGTWTMRAGEHIIRVLTKYETIRHAFSQMIHHRAQLGVYFRLLDISVPASYGPSADSQAW